MKVSRAPANSPGYWQTTDQKLPDEYIDKIERNNGIVLDITKDKLGARHSQILVTVESEDIVALMNKHFQDQYIKIQELGKKIDELELELNSNRKSWDQVFQLSSDRYSEQPDHERLKVIMWLATKFAGTFYIKKSFQLPSWFEEEQ